LTLDAGLRSLDSGGIERRPLAGHRLNRRELVEIALAVGPVGALLSSLDREVDTPVHGREALGQGLPVDRTEEQPTPEGGIEAPGEIEALAAAVLAADRGARGGLSARGALADAEN